MPAPPGLNDAFTEEGYFWFEGNEDNQVAGTLSFDPINGVSLQLLGLLGGLEASFSAVATDANEQATIHGVSKKGKALTLLRSINTKRQLNMPGIANEAWMAHVLLVGVHIGSETTDEVFAKSYFRFESIEKWLGKRAFTETHDWEDGSLVIRADWSREQAFAHHHDFDVSSVGSLYSQSSVSTRYTIDVFDYLAIAPRALKSLSWHLGTAVRLQELAALCAGRYLPLLSLELRGSSKGPDGGNAEAVSAHVYTRLIHSEASGAKQREELLLSGPELIAFNPQAVQAWFDQYDVFSPAISLFFTITGQKKMFTNIRFLLAVQALEVFHRRTTTDAVMAEADFSRFSQALIDAIPPDAPPRMKEKLKGIYQFANEPSLGQRLRAICDELSTAFGAPIAAFDKHYRRKFVDTRNYYTHFSKELRSRCWTVAKCTGPRGERSSC